VAAYAAAQDPDLFDGLILENTFTSIPDMVDNLFYLVGYVKFLILKISWDTKSIVQNLQIPILFVTGDKDELVPSIQTRILYDVAR